MKNSKDDLFKMMGKLHEGYNHYGVESQGSQEDFDNERLVNEISLVISNNIFGMKRSPEDTAKEIIQRFNIQRK